ncbi:hypothetical protein MAP00_001026 [Monascus purpureus]|nr:hypothetical protein MAP00_001026 [Monascus purpureus]
MLWLIEGFLHWYLNDYNVKYQSGFLVMAQYFRIFWCEEIDSLFPYNLRRRMTQLVCTTLTDKYKLDLGAKTQPPINIDDLLYKMYHIMALTNMHSMTVWC